MAQIEVGSPCPTCDFPVYTKPFRAGETVLCPACGEESKVTSEKPELSSTRDLAMTLGAGAFLLFIFTKAKKGDIRVR